MTKTENLTYEKSVIQKVTANGSWESPHGLLYKYEITMENGQAGDINSKVKEDHEKFGWKVGSEVDYTKQEKGTFVNFKKHNPNWSNNISTSSTVSANNVKPVYNKDMNEVFEAKDLRISKLSCLNRAIDLVVAEKIEPHEWEKMSNSFVEWVYGKPQVPAQKKEGSDNLPF